MSRERFDPGYTQEHQGAEWHVEAFQRAYCLPPRQESKRSFSKVCDRLRSGFSVLVYLPGNCMTAAADYVQEDVGPTRWVEYGKHPGLDGKPGGLREVWGAGMTMVGHIFQWLTGQGQGNSRIIYHNLDMLSDGRGGLLTDPDALNMFFALVTATRNGVVLGLSDREQGELPRRIQRIFDETVWLDEIDADAFARLIPRPLADALSGPQGKMTDGAAWLIASRLRWTDPIRAVKIMCDVAGNLESKPEDKRLSQVLTEIWQATRPVEFTDPDRRHAGELTGFEKDTKDLLEETIVKPFKRWLEYSGVGGSPEDYERVLGRLPSGLILHGPTGTGKTYLAQWLAGEMGLPIRCVTAAEVKSTGWGDAEKDVHRLFRDARRAAPCMLVLDDADDLFPDREKAEGGLAGAERSLVNAALQELEGFEGRPAGVFVVLTTNLFESLDRAIKSKLELDVHIPYPLDKDQIGEIVNALAPELGYELTDDVTGMLKELFYVSKTSDNVGTETPEGRRIIEKGLFAARDISQAMRRLFPYDGPLTGEYPPNLDDVVRVAKYYGREDIVQRASRPTERSERKEERVKE